MCEYFVLCYEFILCEFILFMFCFYVYYVMWLKVREQILIICNYNIVYMQLCNVYNDVEMWLYYV